MLIKKKSKENYNKNKNVIYMHVKDLVLLKDNAQKTKLNLLWLGPFKVIEVINDENIIIQRGRQSVTVYTN